MSWEARKSYMMVTGEAAIRNQTEIQPKVPQGKEQNHQMGITSSMGSKKCGAKRDVPRGKLDETKSWYSWCYRARAQGELQRLKTSASQRPKEPTRPGATRTTSSASPGLGHVGDRGQTF